MNSVRFSMGLSVHWRWLAVLSCLLCMGGEVRCRCTEENMQIEGGNYTLTKKLERGSVLVYQCPEDYYPYPVMTRTCQPDGTWKSSSEQSSPQRCKTVECPDPNVLENGSVSPPQVTYLVHNVTTYECYSGYKMRGSSRRVCLKNGKWSGSTPICSSDSGDDCLDPGIPPGASRTGNTFGIDDIVKYTCNGNLFLVGSSERVCQDGGQWTGHEPACFYKHTYDTPLEAAEEFGSSLKRTFTTTQPTDDKQEGRIIRIQKNGTLNIYIAVDISESIDEEQFQKARLAVVELYTKISSFSVSPNYEIVFFSSEVFEIVNILDFFGGRVDQSAAKKKLEEFQIGDKNTGTDLNGVFSTFLERMALIKIQVGEQAFKEHRHALLLFTDGAYNMGGSPAPTVEKIKNMVYMNPTSPKDLKEREEYLDIYVFGIGFQIFDDDLKPLTAGTGGRHFFRLPNIDNLQATFDEMIHEDDVIDRCGLHKVFKVTTKDNKKKMYPWVAFITIKKDWPPRDCLGSLVTPMFVLTAAHCFKDGDKAEHVTVEIDDGQGKTKRVKAFTRHPKYNVGAKVNQGVNEFYDYDVALIQLVEFVKISTDVRRICLPCTQETSDILNLVGESTCKQQEQRLLEANLERLSFLTKTEELVDEKDVYAKLGSSRSACINHALKAPGITTKNVSEVVTGNFLCTGGRSPYRENIACRGDSGGAVFKNYGHHTVQVAVVSWGTKNLCEGGGLVPSTSTSRDFHINLFRVAPFLKSILGKDTDDYAPLRFLKGV